MILVPSDVRTHVYFLISTVSGRVRGYYCGIMGYFYKHYTFKSHSIGGWTGPLKLYTIIPKISPQVQFLYQQENLVPTVNIIFQDISRTFPAQNYHFPGQSIQDLKVIYQDTCKKGYHIYSMYDQLLTFIWYSPLLTPSSCLIQPSFLLWAYYLFTDLFTGNIFSSTIPDFVKFNDISRTWKMNLLFSRLSRTSGNPAQCAIFKRTGH